MKTEVRNISPEVAKEMLRRNSKNRNLSEKHCEFLSKEMIIGNWMFDGQPIRFSTSGTLLDGQHRLNAVVKSGTTQQFLIVTGIESEAFKVMDTGKMRSASDVFMINGIKNSVSAAATTKCIMNYLLEDFTIKSRFKISNTEIVDYYNSNKGIAECVTRAAGLYKSFDKILPLSIIASFMYLTEQKNVEVSEVFWNKLCVGLSLEPKCPTNILRKKLISDRISTARLPLVDRMAFIIKSWNSFRLDKPMTILKWDKSNEDFPVIL